MKLLSRFCTLGLMVGALLGTSVSPAKADFRDNAEYEAIIELFKKLPQQLLKVPGYTPITEDHMEKFAASLETEEDQESARLALDVMAHHAKQRTGALDGTDDTILFARAGFDKLLEAIEGLNTSTTGHITPEKLEARPEKTYNEKMGFLLRHIMQWNDQNPNLMGGTAGTHELWNLGALNLYLDPNNIYPTPFQQFMHRPLSVKTVATPMYLDGESYEQKKTQNMMSIVAERAGDLLVAGNIEDAARTLMGATEELNPLYDIGRTVATLNELMPTLVVTFLESKLENPGFETVNAWLKPKEDPYGDLFSSGQPDSWLNKNNSRDGDNEEDPWEGDDEGGAVGDAEKDATTARKYRRSIGFDEKAQDTEEFGPYASSPAAASSSEDPGDVFTSKDEGEMAPGQLTALSRVSSGHTSRYPSEDEASDDEAAQSDEDPLADERWNEA